jgi:hypothetical protein
MKFIVTETDLENNPILKKRGFKAGDSCETTNFVAPTFKLIPSAQERLSKKEVFTPKENYVEPTLEETVEVITGNEGEGVIVVKEPKKEVKKTVKKAVKKK